MNPIENVLEQSEDLIDELEVHAKKERKDEWKYLFKLILLVHYEVFEDYSS